MSEQAEASHEEGHSEKQTKEERLWKNRSGSSERKSSLTPLLKNQNQLRKNQKRKNSLFIIRILRRSL